jgi:hypothetical protein
VIALSSDPRAQSGTVIDDAASSRLSSSTYSGASSTAATICFITSVVDSGWPDLITRWMTPFKGGIGF